MEGGCRGIMYRMDCCRGSKGRGGDLSFKSGQSLEGREKGTETVGGNNNKLSLRLLSWRKSVGKPL